MAAICDDARYSAPRVANPPGPKRRPTLFRMKPSAHLVRIASFNRPLTTVGVPGTGVFYTEAYPYRGKSMTLGRAIGNVFLGLMLAAVVLGLITPAASMRHKFLVQTSNYIVQNCGAVMTMLN